MPVPALPQAMSLGVVDGGLVPFEVVPPLKLAELVSYSVEGQGVNSRFGTSVFLFAMNKDRYESLPDDLKEIIDRNSGRDFAAQIGDVFNNVEEVGKKMINDGKGQVVQLTPEEKAPLTMHPHRLLIAGSKKPNRTASTVLHWSKRPRLPFSPIPSSNLSRLLANLTGLRIITLRNPVFPQDCPRE